MSPTTSEREEYLTIIAPTAIEAMEQFKTRGLGAQGYSIAGKIGRHQFSLVGAGSATELFTGVGMIAATFSRRVID
ncbi:hypothetical protein PSQ90_05980 [Devosia rhodophyticola]|uniref:Uncharacterized protein n=1 Tax=Devosia rhodophyticola TaxID=3026423 RepID=A0ABY7Z191_9HYPH|nr:hypothetical protein [Devosia rhodophyticola]WDR06985.1 hypothetical protein PSQ90_05980 [Devosia rhodophyticola]